MDFSKLQNLLDEQLNYPTHYDFKFVIKTDEKHNVLNILEDHTISEKLSKNGKYTSITSRKIIQSSDEVVQVYKEMSSVKGVITL